MHKEKIFDLNNFSLTDHLPHYLRAGWRVKHRGYYYIVLEKEGK